MVLMLSEVVWKWKCSAWLIEGVVVVFVFGMVVVGEVGVVDGVVCIPWSRA